MAEKTKPDEQPDETTAAPPAPRTWIADSFTGVVYVHNVDGEGSAVALEAGDLIPAGHEEKIRSHIPTTTTKPRSARMRELDAEIGPDEPAGPGFDPGERSVEDVNAYLRDRPEDVQRVLDLERSGKARRGVLKRD